ncbi:hypothetical protein [Hymenobacter sp. BRD67]|uniref:hypothetical protein n=1 Tax=Hymenobacter sp. BRD67 TaxID=2675877 RepID=UPI001563BC2B|nr:hypothetical protein [Hymenobacter sp. BRD67]QKG53596.1 hypothetical protein GKZ67_14555 [Hymenobacter sp. BRD67]
MFLFGIYATGTGAAPIVRDNIVSGLVNSSTPNATRNAQTVGIFTAATGLVTVTGNQLSNIGNSSTTAPTSTFYHYVSGIYVTGAATGSLVARNRVAGLFSSSTGTGSLADRILLLYNDGTGVTVANNQLSSTGATAAAPNLYGLYENGTGNTYAYNAVYLAGTGSSSTYALYRNSTTAGLVLRNNILYNERSGSGLNLALTTPSTTNFVGSPANPGTNTADYNLYINANSSSYVNQYGGSVYTFAAYKAATGGDGSSLSEQASVLPSASLFTNTSTGDLSVNPASPAAWYANGTGTQVASVGTDYAGTTRSTTVAAGAPTSARWK